MGVRIHFDYRGYFQPFKSILDWLERGFSKWCEIQFKHKLYVVVGVVLLLAWYCGITILAD